jgi:predicted GNAT family N-acyltransferase
MVEFRAPQTNSEWDAYYDLRYRVLRQPWNQPRGSERNEGDATGQHVGLYENTQLVAIARIDWNDEKTAQIRFVAVESNQQGKNYGTQIMLFVEDEVRTKQASKIILHARQNALDFYQKLDYKLIEKSHLLFGEIQHYLMEKEL